MKKKDTKEEYSDEEIARRRDDVVRRMANTPPKPHSEMKVGNAVVKKKTSLKNEKKKPNG